MIINPYSFVSLDSDAQAFLTAAGITDPTISTAINTLVVQLKADNIWSKMKAIYPMVGGTASTHKWNLKDPRDLDAAFRLQFFGGWTHSTNGAQPNGTNGYADTYFNALVNFNINNTHLSIYSKTNGTGYDLGNINGSNLTALSAGLGGVAYSDHYNYVTARVSQSVANTQGFYIGSRTNNVTHKLYKSGNQIGTTNTGASGIILSLSLFLGALNASGLGTIYSNKQYSLCSIGDGLTDTESANFSTAVQTFQTSLSRQV